MEHISFYSESIDFQTENTSLYSKWIDESIQKESFSTGEISIIFTSDEYLLNLNRESLNHDYYTDIITFDYCQDNIINGDLFISIDRVKDNAKQFEEPFDKELSRVIIHGVMHLCGYKDKTHEEEQLMREKENFYLSLQPEK